MNSVLTRPLIAVSALAITSLLLGAHPARAAEEVKLVRPEEKSRIVDLSFNTEDLVVLEKEIEGQATLWAQLEGKFLRKAPNHSLLLGLEPISFSPETGDFKFEVRLRGQSTPITLIVIDPLGAQSKEEITLEHSDWDGWVTSQKTPPSADPALLGKKQGITVGVSGTLITYQETMVPDFTETALTLKAGYSYAFSPQWESSLGGYGTLLGVTRNQAGVTARFYGLNLRVGYNIPALQSELWKITLNGGAYYTTMTVTDDRFGFVNMSGPQVFPTVMRRLANGNSWSAYAKYSPVSSTLNGLSFSNRELAVGGGYHWKRLGNPEDPTSARTISAVVDISNMKLFFPNSIIVNANSMSLGVAYGF